MRRPRLNWLVDIVSCLAHAAHRPTGTAAKPTTDRRSSDVQPLSAEQITAAHDLARGLIDQYGQYHNHKEQMAYTGAVLYLGAAATVTFGGVPWLKQNDLGELSRGLCIFLFAGTALAGFSFVAWQFHQRFVAAALTNGAINLASRWLQSAPTSDDLRVDRVRLKLCGRSDLIVGWFASSYEAEYNVPVLLLSSAQDWIVIDRVGQVQTDQRMSCI